MSRKRNILTLTLVCDVQPFEISETRSKGVSHPMLQLPKGDTSGLLYFQWRQLIYLIRNNLRKNCGDAVERCPPSSDVVAKGRKARPDLLSGFGENTFSTDEAGKRWMRGRKPQRIPSMWLANVTTYPFPQTRRREVTAEQTIFPKPIAPPKLAQQVVTHVARDTTDTNTKTFILVCFWVNQCLHGANGENTNSLELNLQAIAPVL